jgi:hypothetical protein
VLLRIAEALFHFCFFTGQLFFDFALPFRRRLSPCNLQRIKTQTQQDSQQLVEGTGHSDDSSAQQYSQQLIHGTGDWDDSSISSSWSGSSTDSLGFNSSLELGFFDIEVFEV